MAYFNSWTGTMQITADQFYLIILFVTIGCILAMPLILYLIRAREWVDICDIPSDGFGNIFVTYWW